MKLKDLKQHDILFDHTDGNFLDDPMIFVCNAIQSITNSKWNHVKSVHQIIEPTPDGIFISEAAPSGYIKQSLRDSTGKHDTTMVCRYCADNVEGRELTPEQCQRLYEWDVKRLSEEIPYGFTQIAMLAILKQMENDSVAGMFLGKTLEEAQQTIEEFGKQYICSEAKYLLFAENGIDIGILKDSSHLSHYISKGNAFDRYKAGVDDLNPVIADWISPHDLFMARKIIRMEKLEINWR